INQYKNMLNNPFTFKCKNINILKNFLKILIDIKEFQKIKLNFFLENKVTYEVNEEVKLSNDAERKYNKAFINKILDDVLKTEKDLWVRYYLMTTIFTEPDKIEVCKLLYKQQTKILNQINEFVIPNVNTELSFDSKIRSVTPIFLKTAS
ncbi:hypothetical protein J7L48_04405, partial [bacterium]|nr:hypothetical protein [bacterium]